MRKKALFLLVVLFSLCSCKNKQPASPGSSPESRQAESDVKVILRINDLSYNNKDLRDFIQLQYASIMERADESGMPKKDDAALLSLLFRNFVDQMLVLYATSKETIMVENAEVTEFLKKIDDNQADSQLNLNLVREMIKIQKFLNAKVFSGIDASDAEMEKYYQEHMAEFNKAEEIFLHQILLENREKAIKIRGELVNIPRRFEEIARSESKSMEAASGGKMGFFERGQLPKEMEDVVFSLKKNEISPVVESPYGFHIFKVTDKKNPKQLSYFQVKNDIRGKLVSQKTGAAYQDFLQRLRAETRVQIFKENLYFPYQENDGETT